MKFVGVQGAEESILGLIAGLIEIDRDIGRGQAFLAVQFDAAFGAPSIERGGENIDIIGKEGRVDHHRHSLHRGWKLKRERGGARVL